MDSMVQIQEGGWSLIAADVLTHTSTVIKQALQLPANARAPIKRSRHASTFVLSLSSWESRGDLFVKHFDPLIGIGRIKSWFRGSRCSRTQRITAALSSAGFLVPPLLLYGVNRKTRSELIVTERAEGEGPILALQALRGSIAAKRAALRALGGEIGRLHRAGFIHGDLTPFNIRFVIDEPPRFAFIDNDRTRRNFLIGRQRRRLRNLVQLGRFRLSGITRADRVRVFRAYEAALYGSHSSSRERKLAAMLRSRLSRDNLNRLV
jgi:hypothetical protein